MARQVRRISDLPEAAPIQGDELLEIVQGGVNVRVRADELGGGTVEIDDVVGLPEALSERVLDDDPRLSDARTPTGGAGGVLGGQYPNPGFAVDMATQQELDTAVALRVPLAQKGAPSGVGTLDSNGKQPLSEVSDAVLGQVEYKGTWNAATNTPELPSVPEKRGDYYVTNTAGTQFGLTFQVGDWIISDGTQWDKVDNTDAVQSVQGRTGAVMITRADLSLDPDPDKDLSTEDYTTGEKSKLGDLPTAAELTQELADINTLIGDTSAALDAINGEVI